MVVGSQCPANQVEHELPHKPTLKFSKGPATILHVDVCHMLKQQKETASLATEKFNAVMLHHQ